MKLFASVFSNHKIVYLNSLIIRICLTFYYSIFISLLIRNLCKAKILNRDKSLSMQKKDKLAKKNFHEMSDAKNQLNHSNLF
jgi:hypothetical protein